MVFFWLGAVEVESFDILHSFLFLFMVIIGGMGSLIGSFMGAAFIWILPIIIKFLLATVGVEVSAATVEHVNFMIVGALIIFFLAVEPNGLPACGSWPRKNCGRSLTHKRVVRSIASIWNSSKRSIS